jgi:hypothetical protein
MTRQGIRATTISIIATPGASIPQIEERKTHNVRSARNYTIIKNLLRIILFLSIKEAVRWTKGITKAYASLAMRLNQVWKQTVL